MVGSRLRNARQSQHLSLTTVASKAKISAATLSRIETSKQAIDLGLFLILAKILKVSPGDLLGDEEQATVDPVVSRLAALDSGQRTKFWRELSAARKVQRSARRVDIRYLSQQVEELLAQIDFMRDEIESVRLRLKKRR